MGCFQSLVSYIQMFSGFALSNLLLLPPGCTIPLTKIQVMAFNVFPSSRLCPPRLLPPLLLPWFLHGSLGPSYLMSHHDLTDSPHCHGGYLPKVQLSWRNLRIKSSFSAWPMENDLMYDLLHRYMSACSKSHKQNVLYSFVFASLTGEKWKWKLLSRVWLFVTTWSIQSVEFSRSEYWSG
mgnify:CR=1 FL=1